ncbi:hypothetical protein HYH03_007112 [Edaphochlamys debaryana]|uniref:Uncharacterized protein n=1 Tax=Edaphochlamys debaryana TaxID=47281 RepID=A0A835Y521_9CHLO|nr:hypothetical protein HYH03_007112 [Edaphochlamys debaryana]|eukprot:KAG2494873.1 hypothetical protein HYH03_007112 [Edaphochlamys debaryana]
MVNYVGIVAPQAPVPHDAGMAAAADNGAEVAGPLLNPSPSPKLLSPRDTAFHPAAAAASPQRDQVLLPGAANASALALDDTSAALDSEPVTPSRKPAARDGSAGGASGDGSPGEQQPTAGLAALALLTELAAEAEGATPPAAAGSGPSGGPLTLEPSRGSLRSAGGSLGLLTPGMSGDASDLPACEKCDSPVALACSPAMAEPEPEAEAELEVPAAAGPAPPSPAAARSHLEGASALRDSPRTANRRATNTVANLVKKMVPSFRVSEAVGASLAGEQLPLSGDTPASKGAEGVSPARAGVPTAPVLFGVADDAEEAAASPCTKSKLAYGTVAQVVKKMVPSFRESEVMTSSLTGEQALAAAAVLAAAPSVCGGAGSMRVSAAGLPQAEPEGVQRLGSEEVPALEVEVEDEVLGLTQEEAPASAGPSGSSRPAPPELFVFGLAHEQPKIRTPTIKPRPNSAKANGGPKTPSSNDPAARKRKADEEVLPSAKVATPPSAAATSSSPPSASPAAAAAAAPSTPVAGTTISPFAPPAAPPDTPPAPELSSMIVSELEPTASPLLEARSVNQPLKQEPAAPSPAAASSAAVATDAAAAAKAEEAVSAAVEVAASAEAAKATPVAEPPAKAAETVPVPKAAQEPKPKGFLAGLFRCFKP